MFQAVTGHKDVITPKKVIEGVLSEIVDEIGKKELEKAAITLGARGELDPVQVKNRQGKLPICQVPFDF